MSGRIASTIVKERDSLGRGASFVVAGVFILAVAFASTGLAAAPATASAAAEKAVASGREALDRSVRSPWYDSKEDALRPVQMLLMPNLGWLGVLIYWVIVGAVAAGLLLVAYLVVRKLLNRDRRSGPTKARVDPLLAADRVEALPFLAERSRDDLLGQTRRHYQQGNYSEAIIYLFSYELVQLDKFALIHLAKGKTNRQYLRETARARPIDRMLERTMLAFEDVFFGSRTLDRAGFEACWNQLGEFENLVSDAEVAP
jgi:hypothetical protein